MGAKLNILIPKTINDTTLTSSSVPEADYPVWNSSTIYGLGDRCIKNHGIYESQVAASATPPNQNKDPEDLVNQFGTIIYWNYIDPTNRYAMFDGYVSTQTIAVGSITVVIKAGAINWVALDGLEKAKDVDVVIRDAPGGNIIFTYEGSLRGNRPSTYWQYWFNGFDNLKSKIISGIPPYANMEITLTLNTAPGAELKCGMLGVGMVQKLGNTQQGVKAKPKNYGYVEVDKYGKTSYKIGKKAIDIDVSAVIDKDEMRQVQRILESAIGVPSLVSCSENDDYSGLNVWGFVDGQVLYKTGTTSEVSLTQSGVI